MTKREEALENLKRVRELRRKADGIGFTYHGDLTDAIADYLLADDEPTQPVDPYAWVRALPNNTPVEVHAINTWFLRYFYNGRIYSERNGINGRSEICDWDDIRWPLPPDGWTWARKNGRTHVVLAQNGGVFTTGDPEDYLIGYEFAAVVPIPEATDD